MRPNRLPIGIRRPLLALGLPLGLLLAVPAGAQPAPPPAADWIPAALKPWIGWVLRDAPEARCPRVGGAGERTCVFASSLAIAIDEAGATFRVEAGAHRQDAPLALPGGSGAWPQDVTIDGKAVPVTSTQGVPHVLLAAGTHRIEGRITWTRMPAQLGVPAGYAAVSALLRGRAVRPDDAGIIWLVQGGTRAAEADSVSLRVFRQIIDDVPAVVETDIELTVAGKPREISIAQAVLPGFAALQLRGTLPMRLDGARLRVQAVAGKSWVSVRSRRDAAISRLELPAGSDPEIWSFTAVDDLRRVDVQGPVAVDPHQADVPGQWQQFPAWRLQAGQALTVTERHRGDAGQAPSRLSLARTLWLDEGGTGLTFRDQVSGTLSGAQGSGAPPASWRLQMQEPFELGRASLNGQEQYLTRTGASSPPGIEVRGASVNLEADGRVQGRFGLLPFGAPIGLPTAGWATDLQQAGTALNVPPGWRLLHASGVERAVGAWTDRWTLWDLFLMLLICFAAARVFGRATALVLAAALVLSWTLPQSPGWIWLLPIVAGATETAAGGAARVGRMARLIKRAGLAAVALSIIVFSVDQIRSALHPVLEEGLASGQVQAHARQAPQLDQFAPVTAAAPPAAQAQAENKMRSARAMRVAPDNAARSMLSGANRPGTVHEALASSLAVDSAKVLQYEAVDPTARVQTGPGVPTWQWRSYALQWSGPVKAGQHMTLWLVAPWLVRIGNIVTVLLLLGALWMMAGRPRPPIAPIAAGAPPRSPQHSSTAPVMQSARAAPALALVAASTLLAAALLGASPSATAQEPEGVPRADAPAVPDAWQRLLRDLRTRLLETPPCAPSCAAIGHLNVEARADRVELRVQIHAQVDAAVLLPGGPAWRTAHNEIDGHAGQFTDLGNGQAAAMVSAGVHTVVRSLAAADVNEIAIALPSAPGVIETRLDGWQISGLADDATADATAGSTAGRSAGRSAGAALNLVRTRYAGSADHSQHAGADAGIAPLARIERTLALGSRWQLSTSIERVDSGGRPQEVRVALLPGEAVTTPTVRVAAGFAIVSVPAGASATFSSTIPATSAVTLTAGREPGQFEVWTLEASSMWTVAMEGTPPVLHVRDGLWSPQWRPWPGESATVSIRRPEGVPGDTLTIDEVQLQVSPAGQATDIRAQVAIRASLGGTHRLTLPEGARILGLKVDGRELPAYAEGSKVPVLIEPGAHRVELAWREDRGIGNFYRVPQLGLGATAVNASIQAGVPADRWLLLAMGPTMGPVVLFWSMLVVIVLVALAAARLVRSPLSTGAWVVLAIGAGQAGLVPALTVLAFIGAVSARERWGQTLTGWRFNLAQVGLACLAVVAVATLFNAVHNGLLGRPSMLVVGNDSSDQLLRWYQDRTTDSTPAARIVSLPLWVWRIAMLAWSVWLALTVVRIAGWVWHAFGAGGRWHKTQLRASKAPAMAPAGP